MLSNTHIFSYEKIFENPKQEPPSMDVDGLHYEVLHNNNFLRLHTPQGRTYHHMQANYYYQLPDWKLHFAIQPEDLPRAWNIIANLFIERRCQSTMKMIVADYGVEKWAESMHGREITVYIYQHKKYYEGLNWGNDPDLNMQQSREFWMSFAAEAEARLQQNQIKPRQHPAGEMVLGVYVSFRNEAYIKLKSEWAAIIPLNLRVDFNGQTFCYPPNTAGYNAAGHKNPFEKPLHAFFSQSPIKKFQRNKVKEELARQKLTLKNVTNQKPEKDNFVTLHIKTKISNRDLSLFSENKPESAEELHAYLKKLIKILYEKFLQADPKFHFFFEPELIIRISSPDVLEKIKTYLTQEKIGFVVYDYPTPKQNPEYYCYGENEGGPVAERLDLYLTVFHANAIAALTLTPEKQEIYAERLNHTMFNMAGFSRHAEAERLLELAELKAEKPLQLASLYKG